MRCLDSHVVEVESAFGRFFDRQAEHYLSCQVDEVHFQDFRHEGEAAGGAQVAFYDFYVVVLGKELDVERSRDVQRLCDFCRNFFNAPHCFDVEFLWRELYGCVAGVYACEFDVLRYCVCLYFSAGGDGVHFYFLGVLYEFGYDHGVLLRYVRRQAEEAYEFVVVGAYVHCRA